MPYLPLYAAKKTKTITKPGSRNVNATQDESQNKNQEKIMFQSLIEAIMSDDIPLADSSYSIESSR